MHSEPNLRAIERAYIGRPYGYGRLPEQLLNLPNPLGGPRQAVSRPQPMQRDPEGSKPTDRTRAVLDLIDLWDKFKETFREVPGLWRSLLGLLATPFRWLRWAFTTPGVRVLSVAALILLILAVVFVPLMTTGHREPRRAEGEQLMGAARDFARVQYSKTGKVGDTALAFEQEITSGSFEGEYYTVSTVLVPLNDTMARIYVYSTTSSDTPGYIEFEWASGSSNIIWDYSRRRR
jgi:hypothetical protein